MNDKNYLKQRFLKGKSLICIVVFLSMFITGCQQKSTSIKTNNNHSVADNEILHVDITEDEDALSSVYLLSEENEFGSTFINKYDIGIHSKEYKIKLKIEYLNSIQRIDYMNIPSSSTITHLYITMDNYDFIIALFDETELISKGVFDISALNKEDENFLCKGSSSDKVQAIGLREKLSNDLLIYNTVIDVVHGNEEWNEDNEEKIALSVILEDK